MDLPYITGPQNVPFHAKEPPEGQETRVVGNTFADISDTEWWLRDYGSNVGELRGLPGYRQVDDYGVPQAVATPLYK